MAQGRMLRKDICESDSFAALKDSNSQLLLCLLTMWWSDHGKMIGEPEWVKGNVVRKLKQFTLKEIERCLQNINDNTDAQWWIDEKNNRWLYWPKFDKHQTIANDKKTKDLLPSPTLPQKSPKIPRGMLPQVEPKVELKVEDKIKIISSQAEGLLRQFNSTLQEKIKVYMDRVRNKNKSGVITEGRKLTLLTELWNVRGRCNDDTLFAYALEAAIGYDAPNIGYISAVIKNKKAEKK